MTKHSKICSSLKPKD